MRKPFGLFVALVPLLVIAGLACGTTTSEGVVDHKSIAGYREEASREVLLNRPGDDGPIIHVEDKDLLGLFATGDEHAIIGDSMAFEIESRYDRVDYIVNIDLASSAGSGTQPYRVSREVFNQLRVGDTVEFKTKQGGDFPKIEQLISAQSIVAQDVATP